MCKNAVQWQRHKQTETYSPLRACTVDIRVRLTVSSTMLLTETFKSATLVKTTCLNVFMAKNKNRIC